MPFDYDEYEKKCNGMNADQLQKEWENYTRQIAGGATSTATSVLFSPLTAGISLVGLGLSAPRIHNARKKREIIEKGLQERGTTHNTRSRDVAGSMALSGAISVATLGLAGPLADAAAGEAVGKGVEYAVAHVALDGAGAGVEHVHDSHSKKKGEQELKMKAMQAQLAQLQGPQVMVNGQYTQTQQYHGVHTGGFQQPSLTPGLSLPQPGILMQNQQQIQWQQQQPGLQMPGMQQPQMQIPGLQPGVMPPLRPHSAAPDNQYRQYAMPNQQMQPQQQFPMQPLPQYQQPQQQDGKYHLNVIPNPQQQQQSQQQDGKYHLNVIPNPQQQQQPMYPNEKSAAYTTEHMQGDMTPLPLYSQQPAQQDRGHPDHIDIPGAPTMEQEIVYLKARLLQMELQKRGMSATISGPLEISLDGGPKAKEVEMPHPSIHEVASPGPTPQAPQDSSYFPADVKVETRDIAAPQRSNTLPMPPPVQIQPQREQQEPAQIQQIEQPQHVPQPAPQQVQNHQGQAAPPTQALENLSISSPPQQQYQAQAPVPQIQSQQPIPIPAPQQQNYAPALSQQQQQQQQVPIYQPQPINPQVQAQQQQQQQQQQVPIYQPQPINPQIQAQQAAQQQPQPQYAQEQQQVYQQNVAGQAVRHDSGYYSQASTPIGRPGSSISSVSSISSISSPVGRHSSVSSYTPYPHQAQQYQPPQQNYQIPQQPYQPVQPYNPQNHGRSQSVASVAPPPYFPPPPNGPQPVLAGKDYFNQGPPQLQQQQQYPGFPQYAQVGQRGSVMGPPQGWQPQQWNMPGQVMGGQQQQQMVGHGGEPNYGPPPPIPGVWRG